MHHLDEDGGLMWITWMILRGGERVGLKTSAGITEAALTAEVMFVLLNVVLTRTEAPPSLFWMINEQRAVIGCSHSSCM